MPTGAPTHIDGSAWIGSIRRAGVLLALWLVVPGPSLGAQQVYWADQGSHQILRAAVDGTSVRTLEIPGLDGPDQIAIDAVGGKIYWSQQNGRILRANLDGSGVETLIDGGGDPVGLTVDAAAGHLYWADPPARAVMRSGLDGTDPEVVVHADPSVSGPYDLGIDRPGGRLFWTIEDGFVFRSSLDGASVEAFFTHKLVNAGLDLDLAAGKVYWAAPLSLRIYRDDLTGDHTAEFFDVGPGAPVDVAIDAAAGKIYWTTNDPAGLHRANLDLTGRETLASSGVLPRGVALGPAPGSDIPALSHGGLVVLALLLLASATLVLRRHRAGTPAER